MYDNIKVSHNNVFTVFLYIAILDLQKLLAMHEDTTASKNSLDIPRHLILQFDNCGENKVIYVCDDHIDILL